MRTPIGVTFRFGVLFTWLIKPPVAFIVVDMLLGGSAVVAYHLTSFSLTHLSGFFLFISFVLRVMNTRGDMGFESYDYKWFPQISGRSRGDLGWIWLLELLGRSFESSCWWRRGGGWWISCRCDVGRNTLPGLLLCDPSKISLGSRGSSWDWTHLPRCGSRDLNDAWGRWWRWGWRYSALWVYKCHHCQYFLDRPRTLLIIWWCRRYKIPCCLPYGVTRKRLQLNSVSRVSQKNTPEYIAVVRPAWR